ncbi:hypothetical protein HNQ34_002778 [Anoxybacillus tepidamans]|uniref:Uncharacterized protein n=1 Tax=Anoxybacteroides tepidamans TaxID=265948 RepID=A0A7W8MVJ4_9BACL|nr:hypothetical protein [Anoxybacillus tepidamans]
MLPLFRALACETGRSEFADRGMAALLHNVADEKIVKSEEVGMCMVKEWL